MYDEYFEGLTNTQIQDKIVQLSKQYEYYKFKENDQVIENIRSMLDALYNIKDERAYLNYYDKFKTDDGVVIDASTHGQKSSSKKDANKKQTHGRKPAGITGSHI